MKGHLLGALAFTLVCAQPASAAVTARQVGVYGDVRGGFAAETTRPSNNNVVTGLPTAPVIANSFATGQQGFNSFVSLSNGMVTLLDPSRGMMFFNASTQTTAIGNPGSFARAIAATQYLFTLSTTAIFRSEYNVVSTGTPAGYFRLGARDANGNFVPGEIRQQSGLQGVGGFTYTLTPGSYSLDWSNNVNTAFSRSNAQMPIDLDSVSGTLVFGIAAVPEPATWGMMLLGFGALGFAMRRRDKVRMTVSYA